MKFKKLFLVICIICFGLALSVAAACGGENDGPASIPVISVAIDKTSAELEEGDTVKLTAIVLPGNATDKTVLWESSDKSVATVSGGTVTAIAAGTANITASAGGKTAVCTVTVTKKSEVKIPVANITLNKETAILFVGESYTLITTVLPANATSRTVSWRSDSSCVTVSDKGEIKAVSAGTATVTATADGKSATCRVTVYELPAVEEVTLDKTALTLTVGETDMLNATVTPAVAPVVWKSSDDGVVTVSGGKITAVGEGNAVITATADGKSATCTVIVKAKITEVVSVTLSVADAELTEGETLQITASVSPANATENEVSWSSSNGAVATVSDGLVTAVATGTANIIASAGGKTAVCEIAVVAREPEIPENSIITYAHSGAECAAFEWKDADAPGAKVEYKLSSATRYTAIDKQLIRQITDTVARADAPGLKGGEKYDFKITSSDGKTAYAKEVVISSHDRTGYAHHNYTNGVGAYNDDGTLKAGAKVIYVTEANKNDVDGKGNSIAEYLTNAQNNTSPIVIRIIGTVGSATWNKLEYNAPGHEGDDITEDKVIGINGKKLPTDSKMLTQSELIKGGYNTLNEYPEKLGGARCVAIDGLVSRASYSSGEYDSLWNDCQIKNVSNITIEGIGEDAEIFQWGFTFKSCNSVEVRNLRFYDYTEDACSIEGSENSTTLAGFRHKNFWIHRNTFDIGMNYWDVCAEQDKHDGDGATDFKYLAYVTISYNRYNGTHKTGLVGGGDSAHQACFTFHHNYYNGCDQRMPLGRQANMHMYNNYYSGSGLYSISLRAGAYAFIENCVFTSSKSSTVPVELRTGSNGTPSCKIINCEIEGKITNPYGSDQVYVGDDRTVTVQGDNLYGQNFELDPDFYTVTDMLPASEVKTVIPGVAGVMKRNSNIKIEGGSEEEEPPVIVPPEPSDGQSVSFTSDDEGKAVAVDEIFADGDLFTAGWNKTKAAVTKGISAAVADDGSEKSFGYALLSNGTGGGVTVTAKSAVTLTVYYGASDSKFTTVDQAKSGNLSWTVDGVTQTSDKTENKSNKVAYSEVITLEAGQTAVFEISANRFVLYGLYAE